MSKSESWLLDGGGSEENYGPDRNMLDDMAYHSQGSYSGLTVHSHLLATRILSFVSKIQPCIDSCHLLLFASSQGSRS